MRARRRSRRRRGGGRSQGAAVASLADNLLPLAHVLCADGLEQPALLVAAQRGEDGDTVEEGVVPGVASHGVALYDPLEGPQLEGPAVAARHRLDRRRTGRVVQ
eukprot:scaffold105343_cov49-Phaeocystis_antarctica.AAC.3